MVKLFLLGPLEVGGPDGKDPLKVLASPKRLAVLAHLLLFMPGKFVSRDHLLALFWPRADEAHARNALNQILHGIRASCGKEIMVSRGRREIGVNPEAIRCDAVEFLACVKEGSFHRAVDLYRGDLMEGFHLAGAPGFAHWLEEERERMKDQAAEAHWSVAQAHLQAGRLRKAARSARRALELDGSEESRVQDFILALALAGDGAAALRFYRRFEEKLREGLNLDPSPRTLQVVREIRGRMSPSERADPVPAPLLEH
jgi:DNA-binding SARP family transcriptional activator